jgi:hypothetical protein
LLHHRPLAIVGDDEAVQVEIESILHRGAVDLGHQAACALQGIAVEAHAVADLQELVRRLARVPAATAANVNAELMMQRLQPALERADHARRDARGMPVHAHDAAEGLEPEGMREPAQQLFAAVVMHDGLADHRAKAAHAVGQPFRHLAAMQRKIGASRSPGHLRILLAGSSTTIGTTGKAQ